VKEPQARQPRQLPPAARFHRERHLSPLAEEPSRHSCRLPCLTRALLGAQKWRDCERDRTAKLGAASRAPEPAVPASASRAARGRARSKPWFAPADAFPTRKNHRRHRSAPRRPAQSDFLRHPRAENSALCEQRAGAKAFLSLMCTRRAAQPVVHSCFRTPGPPRKPGAEWPNEWPDNAVASLALTRGQAPRRQPGSWDSPTHPTAVPTSGRTRVPPTPTVAGSGQRCRRR
jgi:hypothetical protein